MPSTMWFAIGITVLFTTFVLIGSMDMQDESAAERHYCDMVEIFDKSGGEYGWPPYRGREICN